MQYDNVFIAAKLLRVKLELTISSSSERPKLRYLLEPVIVEVNSNFIWSPLLYHVTRYEQSPDEHSYDLKHPLDTPHVESAVKAWIACNGVKVWKYNITWKSLDIQCIYYWVKLIQSRMKISVIYHYRFCQTSILFQLCTGTRIIDIHLCSFKWDFVHVYCKSFLWMKLTKLV